MPDTASDTPDHDISAEDRPFSSPALSARTFLVGFAIIIVATGVFSFFIARKVRRDAVVMTDQVRLVGQAMLAYSTAHGAFPPDRDVLEAFLHRGGLVATPAQAGTPATGSPIGPPIGIDATRAALARVEIVWPEDVGAAPKVSAGGRPVKHGVAAEVQAMLDAEAERIGGSPDSAVP